MLSKNGGEPAAAVVLHRTLRATLELLVKRMTNRRQRQKLIVAGKRGELHPRPRLDQLVRHRPPRGLKLPRLLLLAHLRVLAATLIALGVAICP